MSSEGRSESVETLAPSAATVGDGRAAPSESPQLEPGAVVGRYRVLEHLGRGGMGEVYAAFDPDLDRKVALKIFRRRSSASEGQRRLLREAQAMARLSHPNVVTVHDVGTHEGSVFVAMELIDGVTLSQWLAQKRRRWREVLEVYVRAGAGLAAAHVASLVHRDFKPDNVMLGTDGRIRVMDFGLARATGETGRDSNPAVPDATYDEIDRRSDSPVQLTRTGALVGTPAYMAPEQHLGSELDARADQFSFCVSLYEGLYRERPFAGATLAELGINVARGRVRNAPDHAAVPSWLRKALLRGLAVEPRERWPTMESLLAILRRRPHARARLLATGSVVVVAVGTGIYASTTSPTDPCGGAEGHLGGVWNDSRRGSIEAAFAATGVPYASDSWRRVEFELEAHAAGWVEQYTAACEAARGEPTTTLLDLRMVCHSRDLDQLDALVTVLSEADADSIAGAVAAVDGLPDPSRCADPDFVQGQVQPPSDAAIADAVVRHRSELDRARALRRAGRYHAGRPIAERIVAMARELDYRPLTAEALIVVAELENSLGEFEAAQRDASDGFFLARSAGHDRAALKAALLLLRVTGYSLASYDDAIGWARIAEVGVEPGSRDEAHFLGAMGSVMSKHGRFPEALDYHERALALDRRLHGPEHPAVANAHNSLAVVHHSLGDYAKAAAEHRESIAITEATLGPSHPNLANALLNLGNALRHLRDFDGAIEQYRRALSIREASLGPTHPRIADTLNNLGIALVRKDDDDGALEHFRRALWIMERALGPEHADVGSAMTNIANLLDRRGEQAEASGMFERAYEIATATLGPEHPTTATLLHNLGTIALHREQYDRAIDQLSRAAAIKEASLGRDHPRVALSLSNVGSALLKAKRPQEAIAPLERALVILESNGGETGPDALADASFYLARALRSARDDRVRAQTLARRARELYREHGDTTGVGRVDAWLGSRR